MCCEPIINDNEPVGVCPECGGNVDVDGTTTEVCCGYSPIICRTCGDAPCDQSC